MIDAIIHTIGQIGLHLITDAVSETVKKSGGLSLFKVGDVSLVRIDEFRVVLALTNPLDRPSTPLNQVMLRPENVVAIQAVPGVPHDPVSVGANPETSSTSTANNIEEKPPVRMGIAAVFDENHELRAGFQTMLSESVRLFTAANHAQYASCPAFDNAADLTLAMEGGRPTSVFNFVRTTEEIKLSTEARVTPHTTILASEVSPGRIIHIEGRLPVVITRLPTFPGGLWHLSQKHPQKSTKHYILAVVNEAKHGI